jgi:hypothetical protein
MSYAIPAGSAINTAPCTYVEETTPGDIWTPVGSIAPGLSAAIGMRGTGYWRRTVVVRTAGAAKFTSLMASLQANEDEITWDAHTYSLLSVEVGNPQGTQDTNDKAKQCSVTITLWRP